MKRHALILLILPFILSSCATVDSSRPSIGYNILFSPGQHIRKLIQQKNFADAEKVYNREIDYFEKNPVKYSHDIKNLANELNSTLIKDANELLSLLDAVKWPESYDKWPDISITIDKCDNFLNSYYSRKIFDNTDIVLPSVSQLKLNLSNIKLLILKDVEQAFYVFPHYDNQDFFIIYPLKKPNTSSMLDGFNKHLTDECRTSNKDVIKNISDIYKQYFGDSFASALVEIYYKTVLSEFIEKDKPNLSNIVKAINETKKINTPLKSIQNYKIKFIDATTSTIKKGEIDFPVSINMDLPFTTVKNSLADDISQKLDDDSQIVIIIETSVAQNSQSILKRDALQSEYRSGMRTDPNPDYNMAQNYVNNARQAVLEAQMLKSSIDSQYCYGAGCWAKLANQITAITLIKKKNNELDEAMQRLGATPMTIEVPVYKPYEFHKVQISSLKASTLNYYVIDKLSNTYYAGNYNSSQKKNFVVTYDLHELDKIRSSHLYGCDREEDISKFEETPVTINISSILEQYISDESKHVSLPSIGIVKQDILERRSRAVASLEKPKYESKPKQNDKRFESVVIINNPKGSIGAGFFISDELIITNYHVIEGAKYVEIKLFNGQDTFGKIIDYDIRLDLVLIKAQARGIPLEFYQEKTIELGRTVEAIGHPKGLEFSITRGIVSGSRKIKSTYAPNSKQVDFIQTDAAINPGNSGGPLFIDNKVIGVNTQKLAAVAIEGIGFAIHHSEVSSFIKRSLEKVK